MKTYAYGFPRLGKQREFKKLIEGFWSNRLSRNDLIDGVSMLQEERERAYSLVDEFPTCEMTFYDHMLDAAILFGVYKANNLNEYFDLCRGKNALEMTKWFNTNYHYLVSDFGFKNPTFKLRDSVVWDRFKGETENVYFVGPLTFLKLSKNLPKGSFEDALMDLSRLLVEIFRRLGLKSVHLDDPAFVMELSETEIKAVERAYRVFGDSDTKVNLFTYYDSVDNLNFLFDLPLSGIGIDLVHDRGDNLTQLKNISAIDKTVFLGLVDGRSIWRNNLFKTKTIVERLDERFSVVISNAAPLYHLPISVNGSGLEDKLLSKVAFAYEKLYELNLIKKLLKGAEDEAVDWIKGLNSDFGLNEKVRDRVNGLKEHNFEREPPYEERRKMQEKVLNLPEFPTTTIGSFPQTEEVRKIRLLHKNSQLSDEGYRAFIEGEIAKAVYIQDKLGLDVIVHGEFERTDMVEYFAQKLDGIATTKNGWIISYGTRCYRPPIIYGDIQRKEPMTLKEIMFAQSLTDKPVKGMLTGPVTIIAWSFVREDLPIREVAFQIALALKDEIYDYERSGIKIIQIDEPAFREKAPIKKRNWNEYFEWAIKAFKLAHSDVEPETQIHTHMCYSEFGEIIDYILQLDFDVISIEASRSKGDIITAFENAEFNRQIGLGVWDIHSPLVPSLEKMKAIVDRALKVISKKNFWINPDCGLKTRKWSEVIPSLENMVGLAKKLRKDI